MTDPMDIPEHQRLTYRITELNIFIERLEWEQQRLNDDMQAAVLKREELKEALREVQRA